MLKKLVKHIPKKIRHYSQNIKLDTIDMDVYFPVTPVQPHTSEQHLQHSFHALSQRKQKTTLLENGFQIKSTDNLKGTSVVSLVVNAGSRYETYSTSGHSHFIQRFFFDPTITRSKLGLVSEMQKTGGTVTSSSDRENIIYRSESMREAVPKLLSVMTDSVLYGRLHEWDLYPKRELVKQDILDYSENPGVVLNEALHRTAFGEKNLGNALVCPGYNVNKISTGDIVKTMDKYFNPERMTLVGTNIQHEDLVSLADQLFGEFPEGTWKNSDVEKLEESVYVGGVCRLHEQKGAKTDASAYSVLAYRGVSYNSADRFALQVLANLLGECKFAGMQSLRTYGQQSVLNNFVVKNITESAGKIHEAAAFNINYSDDGLVGVKLSGDSAAVGEGLGKTKDLLQLIADKGVCETNLNRGKNKSIFNFLSSKESVVGEHEASLAGLDDATFLRGVSDVTQEDVQRVAQNMLKTKPTVVSYGNLADVPLTV